MIAPVRIVRLRRRRVNGRRLGGVNRGRAPDLFRRLSGGPNEPERIVIIGASLTGATAATTLREEGFDGSIDLIGAEAQPPYNRPPLSKEYRGQAR